MNELEKVLRAAKASKTREENIKKVRAKEQERLFNVERTFGMETIGWVKFHKGEIERLDWEAERAIGRYNKHINEAFDLCWGFAKNVAVASGVSKI